MRNQIKSQMRTNYTGLGQNSTKDGSPGFDLVPLRGLEPEWVRPMEGTWVDIRGTWEPVFRPPQPW